MSFPNRTTLLSDFHIWQCVFPAPTPHPPRSTFGYTVLRVQPPSWCLLNLGGHTFFLSLLISRQWSLVLELCSQRTDFVSSASLFGAPFSFRCSPGQVSAPFVCLPLVNKYLFSAWHFLCFCGLFSVLTSYSLTSWSPLPLGEDLPAHPKGVPVCCLSCVYFIFHLSANRNSFSWLALSPGIFLIPFFLCTLLCLLVAVKIVPFLPLTLEVASSPGMPDSPALDLNWKRIPPCISLVIHRSLNPDGLLLIRFWLEGYCFFLCFISLHWKTKQNKKTLQRFLVLLPAPKASSLALFLPFIKKRRLLEESLGHSFCSWSRGGRWIFISPCDPLTYLPNLAPDPHLKICKCPLLRASQ